MRYLLLLCVMLLSHTSYSQIQISSLKNKNRTKTKNENIRIGGNMGINFGSNNSMDINLSPHLSYLVSPILEFGISAGYQFNKYANTKRHLLSVGPYMDINPIPDMFLRAQYEHFAGRTSIKYDDINIQKFDDNALWLGGGYRTGDVVQVYAGIMYNVLHKDGKSIFKEAYRPIAGVSVRL